MLINFNSYFTKLFFCQFKRINILFSVYNWYFIKIWYADILLNYITNLRTLV